HGRAPLHPVHRNTSKTSASAPRPPQHVQKRSPSRQGLSRTGARTLSWAHPLPFRPSVSAPRAAQHVHGRTLLHRMHRDTSTDERLCTPCTATRPETLAQPPGPIAHRFRMRSRAAPLLHSGRAFLHRVRRNTSTDERFCTPCTATRPKTSTSAPRPPQRVQKRSPTRRGVSRTGLGRVRGSPPPPVPAERFCTACD